MLKIYFINGIVGLHVAILDANIEVIRRPYVKSITCTNMYIQICMCDCVWYKEITFSIKRGIIKKNNGMAKRSDMRWSTLASLLWLDNSVAGVYVCV